MLEGSAMHRPISHISMLLVVVGRIRQCAELPVMILLATQSKSYQIFDEMLFMFIFPQSYIIILARLWFFYFFYFSDLQFLVLENIFLKLFGVFHYKFIKNIFKIKTNFSINIIINDL